MANLCDLELTISSEEDALYEDDIRENILNEIKETIAYGNEIEDEEWLGEIYEIRLQSEWTIPRKKLQDTAKNYNVTIEVFGVERGVKYCEFLTFNSDGTVTEHN